MLTEVKNRRSKYFVDRKGNRQGEFTSWWGNGMPDKQYHNLDDRIHGEYRSWFSNGRKASHMMFNNGNYNGECKCWHFDGHLLEHEFYKTILVYTDEVKEIVMDFNNITPEEKLMIKLTLGLDSLP